MPPMRGVGTSSRSRGRHTRRAPAVTGLETDAPGYRDPDRAIRIVLYAMSAVLTAATAAVLAVALLTS